MTPPRLPTRPGDAWACGFVFDSSRPVQSVSCHGGLVVAGGHEIHVLRPGAQNMASRPPPLDIGPIHVVAGEQRPPFRYAVGSGDMVAVFFRNEHGDQVLRLRCTPSGLSATHLAWARAEGATVLYVRWSDGVIVRLREDMSGVDTTDLPAMEAIAADGSGVLAMVSFADSTPLAYITRDGEHLEFRPLPAGCAVGSGQRVHLAVADLAVAFAVAETGVFVSRAFEGPFLPVEPLATAGPVVFEGLTSDAPLFGASRHAGVASIIRVDRDGVALRIADSGSESGPPPEFVELAWDGSRKMLWAASPEMGLVTCTAPEAKRGKRPTLS